jgi:hypothetical protein
MSERDRVVAHEAGHACACLALGVPVRMVDTVGGDATRGGWVSHNVVVSDHASARLWAKVIMAGLVEGAETAEDLPRWPLDSRPVTSTDEKNLAWIADYLQWIDDDYQRLIGEVCELTLSDAYQILFVTIVGALDYTPRLDTNAFRRLLPLAIRQMKEKD